MSELIAIDVAVLPPDPIVRLARVLNGQLEGRPETLRLDEVHVPHVTLSQHFVERQALDEVRSLLGGLLGDQHPFEMHVTGVGGHDATMWLTVARSPALDALHRGVMDRLHPLERAGGDAAAFQEPARARDVEWVSAFRTAAAYDAYAPHITLGHGMNRPEASSLTCVVDRVALCALGRFCTCCQILDEWRLR